MDHIRALRGRSYRVFRNICPDRTQPQVVAGVQHTAVCVSSSIGQIVLALLGGSAEHLRTLEMLRKKRLRDLRAEVSKVDHDGVAACLLHILKRLDHLGLALDDADRTFIDVIRAILCGVSLNEGFPAVDRERCREAVAADGYNTDLCLWNVFEHVRFLLFVKNRYFGELPSAHAGEGFGLKTFSKLYYSS